jgi:hypothetical protein
MEMKALPERLDITKLMHILGVPTCETGHDPQT